MELTFIETDCTTWTRYFDQREDENMMTASDEDHKGF